MSPPLRSQWGRAALTCLVLMAAHSRAGAELWPGTDAPPGGAIAAKVIGQQCAGVLEPPEIQELAAFIDKRSREFANGTSDERRYPMFFPRLEQMYRQIYAQPRRCDADAAAMARDMLERVRRVQQEREKEQEQAERSE